MLNGIWMAMIVLAFVGAVCTGRWTALSAAAADGARQAVETVLLLLGAMCLWTGIMRIAGEAGLTNGLSKILSRAAAARKTALKSRTRAAWKCRQ